MRYLYRWCFACFCVLAACQSSSEQKLVVALVSADGNNPLHSHAFDQLTLWFDVDDQQTQRTVLTRGFDAGFDLPVTSLAATFQIRAQLSSNDLTLLGILPRFVPLEVGPVTELLVGETRSCQTVADVDLGARANFGFGKVGSFGVLIGGEINGALANARFMDLTMFSRTPYEYQFAQGLGQTKVGVLSDVQFLALSEAQAPFVYDFRFSEQPSISVALHDGAGVHSGLTVAGANRVAVVGGYQQDEAVAGVSWIQAEGDISSSALERARDLPGLYWQGSRLLVAGGDSDAFSVEWHSPDEGACCLQQVDSQALSDVHVVKEQQGQGLWLIGGYDANGLVASKTWLLRNCDVSCEISEGPVWEKARAGHAWSLTESFGLAVGGQMYPKLIERFVWDEQGPRIESWSELRQGRDNSEVLDLGGAIILVAGGTASGAELTTLEICFPASF